jgi:lipoprotein-anchoring transpeptidase ErfK/SrfK
MNNRRTLASLLLATALLSSVTACSTETTVTKTPSSSATPDAGPALPPGLSTSDIKALPASEYDAVIPGLLAAPAKIDITDSYTVAFDTVVYGADFRTPVARIPAKDFLGQPTVVVRADERGKWSLVLTAARQQLPSKAAPDSPAPAQSAAWVPTASLRPVAKLTNRVVISTSKQTLDIVDARGKKLQSFPVGVGTDETPTPTGTGYLQARYLDPAQGQSEHRIQLTSLHATAADEPYDGSDGGLIGIHYQATATGAVSHGCVRLSAEAIAAVDALPLGTAVQIVA